MSDEPAENEGLSDLVDGASDSATVDSGETVGDPDPRPPGGFGGDGLPGEPSRPGEPPGRTLQKPDLRTARFGVVQELWRLYRHHRKRRRLADEGYVQWFLIDDTFPRPRFVQPEFEGGGIPELEHDGGKYLFPKDAMVGSEQQGLWTIIHKRGEAEPINLREPTRDAIRADELDEYLAMRVTSEPPSWFDGLDVDAATLMKVGLALIVGYAFIQGGGGFLGMLSLGVGL